MDLGAQVVREAFHSSLKLGERVLVALGQPEALAASRAERFREHDEKLLRTQYQVQDDEAALIQTSSEAREELEKLFAADRAEGGLDERGSNAPSGDRTSTRLNYSTYCAEY